MQPPTPSARSPRASAHAVRVIVCFDLAPLATYWVRPRGGLHAHGALRTLWVGDGPGVTVPCPSQALPAARFPLIRSTPEGATLLCPASLLYGLRLDGAPVSLPALCRAGLAVPCDEYPGVWAIDLRRSGALTLGLGLLEFHVCPAENPPRLRLAPRRDPRPQIPTLLLSLLAAAFAILAAALPPAPAKLLTRLTDVPFFKVVLDPGAETRTQDGIQSAAGSVLGSEGLGTLAGPEDTVPVAHRPRGPARAGTEPRHTPDTAAEVTEPGAPEDDPDLSAAGTTYADLVGRGSVLGDAQDALAQVSAGGDGQGGDEGEIVATSHDESADAPIGQDQLSASGIRGSSATCVQTLCIGRHPGVGSYGAVRHSASSPGIRPNDTAGKDAVTCAAGSPCDKDEIRRIVRQHIPEVRYCYERALIRDPALQGRVALRFVIGADGQVSQSTVGASTIASPEVGACIARAARRWQFLPQRAAHIEVNYPFDLRTD